MKLQMLDFRSDSIIGEGVLPGEIWTPDDRSIMYNPERYLWQFV